MSPGKKKKQRNYSPEARQKAADRMRAINAAKKQQTPIVEAEASPIPEPLPVMTDKQKQTPVPETPKPVTFKKVSNTRWWLLIIGVILAGVGVIGMVLYASTLNMFAGFLSVAAMVPGGFFIYYAFHGKKESGYELHEAGKKYTGKENSVVIYARWDEETKKAIPEKILFEDINPPLAGARPHLLRNINRHVYEYINIVGPGHDGKELKPVLLPDKKLCTPEAFVVPSNMQRTKEYMQYNPPSNFQKIASGVLIIVMLVIGILMVMTGPPPDQQEQSRTSDRDNALIIERSTWSQMVETDITKR